MKDVIKKGGDTDTNACIVGFLLGALYGINKLPQNLIKKLLLRKKGIKRPDFLKPGKI